MWFRVDDSFLDHPKTVDAADKLGGRNAIGRVAAVWLELGTLSAKYLTDGAVKASRLARLKTDDKPREVIGAMVRAGLLRRVPGGIQFHDWSDYNPSASDVKAKRRRDRERKRLAKEAKDSASSRVGFRAESASTARAESEALPGSSRARDPVPSRPVPEDQNLKPTAAVASAFVRGGYDS